MEQYFHIETFGCQMNKSDSELMNQSLLNHGFKSAEDADSADIVIFNTCSVRQHAEDRAVSRIQAIRKSIHKKNGIIILTGCMAQRIGDEIAKDKLADLIIGPYESPKIGSIIENYLNDKLHNIYTSQNSNDFEKRINPDLAKTKDKLPWHKWVTITHGCENFCTYCIVPYVRGKLISFHSEEILNYIKSLASNSIKEISLLGQNVNQYGTDNNDIPFYKLLEKIAEIPGLERINFLTSHPKDFSNSIISVIKEHSNISKSIHLPLQSGSDKVLKLMNRKYTFKHYMEIVETIKKSLDTYSISTDLIVGFPGEDENDYNDTLNAVKLIEFDNAFMYAYSPREGTPAFKLEEALSHKEKIDRLQKLIDLERKISLQKLMSRIGNIEHAIIEKISKRSDKHVMGKTFLDHPVIIPGSEKDIGSKISIEIEGVNGSTLQGNRIV